MPDVQNVFRRGGAYWWRRTLHWLDGNARPITLAMSLGTKDLGVARHRAAAMTAQSEVVRMSLYERVTRDGLTVAQRDAVLRSEMRAYRDALEHLAAAWQFKPECRNSPDLLSAKRKLVAEASVADPFGQRRRTASRASVTITIRLLRRKCLPLYCTADLTGGTVS